MSSTKDTKQSEKEYLLRTGGGAWELYKPFVPPGQFALQESSQDIQDFSLLLQMLRPEPDDLILDLGAGSCWCSDWLERLNLDAVSLDISTEMLHVGQQRLRRGRQARLVAGDFEALPFASGSFDKAVCLNALHHVPRLDVALAEIHRVLTAEGMVLFSEPGLGHAQKPWSKTAVRDYGVLEQDIPAERLLEGCLRAGFRDARLKPISYVIPEFDLTLAEWQSWQQFWRRKRPVRAAQKVWRNLLEAFGVGKRQLLLEETFAVNLIRLLKEPVETHPIVVAYKGAETRIPLPVYDAKIEVLGAPATWPAGDSMRLSLSVRNASSRLWRRAMPDRRHGTRIGAHLFDSSGGLMSRDWCRADLPHDVPVGGVAQVQVDTPAIESPGRYVVKFDVVLEGVAWYESQGSSIAEVTIDVAARR